MLASQGAVSRPGKVPDKIQVKSITIRNYYHSFFTCFALIHHNFGWIVTVSVPRSGKFFFEKPFSYIIYFLLILYNRFLKTSVWLVGALLLFALMGRIPKRVEQFVYLGSVAFADGCNKLDLTRRRLIFPVVLTKVVSAAISTLIPSWSCCAFFPSGYIGVENGK